MSELYIFNKKRLIAAFIDLAGIIFYVVILLGVSLTTFSIIGNTPKFSFNNARLLGFLTLTFPVMVYFVISEFGQHHGTIGKRYAGLKVVSFNSRRLTLMQVIVRNIIKFLPWEFAHTLFYILLLVPGAADSIPVLVGLVIANIIPLIYIYLVLFGKDHRGPQDLISGTVVKYSL